MPPYPTPSRPWRVLLRRLSRLPALLAAGLLLLTPPPWPVGLDAPAARAAVAADASDYLRAALADSGFGVESARLALDRAADDEVKALARLMLADQARAERALRTAAGQDSLTLPRGLRGPARAERLEALEAAGAAFDRQYVDGLVEARRRALFLHRAYADGGEGARLRAVAASLAETAERHLALARGLRARLGEGRRPA